MWLKGEWNDYRQARFPAALPYLTLGVGAYLVGLAAGHAADVSELGAIGVSLATGGLVCHARIALWRWRHPPLSPMAYVVILMERYRRGQDPPH